MRPSDLIKARASKNGVISVTVSNNNGITVMGCSVGSSLSGLYDRDKYQREVDSFSFALTKGKTALLALVVDDRYSKAGSTVWRNYFLIATWDENKEAPALDLSEPWQPTTPDRLGQLHRLERHALTVNIGGVLYTTDLDVLNNKGSDRYQNYCFAPSGDQLCQYLLGEASAEDVKKAALEPALKDQLAKSVAEADELSLQLAETKNALAEMTGKRDQLENALVASCKDLDAANLKLASALKNVAELTDAVAEGVNAMAEGKATLDQVVKNYEAKEAELVDCKSKCDFLVENNKQSFLALLEKDTRMRQFEEAVSKLKAWVLGVPKDHWINRMFLTRRLILSNVLWHLKDLESKEEAEVSTTT